ncbi:MAG: hypothetical protein RLY93_16260 [Sumerlaeia bacterium]
MEAADIPVVLVLSHRGGSGKTALAAGIASDWADLGEKPLLVDCAAAGGASALFGRYLPADFVFPVWRGEEKPFPMVQEGGMSMRFLKAGPALKDPQAAERLREGAAKARCTSVVVDLPACGRSELEPLLRVATLVLLVMPVDALAFRGSRPFLEMIQEERARPGRDFQSVVVVNGTGVKNPAKEHTEVFLRQYLGPILAPVEIPHDPSLKAGMAKGILPGSEAERSPASDAILRLAKHLRQMLAQHGTAGAMA